MARLSWLQRLYWRHLSKPIAYRELFEFVIEHPIASILEVGIRDGKRLEQVLSLVQVREGVTQLRYAGVDLFESGDPQDGHLRLKDIHRKLAEQNIKANLIPGDAASSLMRVSHMVQPSDLVIIDENWGLDSANGAALQQWLPRLTHDSSTVFARSNRTEKLARIQLPHSATLQKAA
jgi:hypothetical protein